MTSKLLQAFGLTKHEADRVWNFLDSNSGSADGLLEVLAKRLGRPIRVEYNENGLVAVNMRKPSEEAYFQTFHHDLRSAIYVALTEQL